MEYTFPLLFTEVRETTIYIRGPFKKLADWRQCAAVMQREAVNIMPSCSGGGNVILV
jgi:hypothetical protein